MKNSQAITIYQNKESLNNLKGYAFCRAMHKNFDKIKEELSFINEYVKPSKEFLEFMDKKEEIIKKYSDGKPKQEGEMINYNILKDKQGEYTEEVTKLIEEYKEAVEEFKAQKNNYEEALKAECEIDFVMLKESDVPEDISMEQMDLVMHFIKM